MENLMAEKLSASVGKKGKNNPEDVMIIQKLLNLFADEVGFSKMNTDGQHSTKLEKAIGLFQTNICNFKADERVDPGKNTLKALNAGIAKAKSNKKSEDQKIAKIKEDQRQLLLKTVKLEVEKQAKAQSVPKSSWASLFAQVEKRANELYDSYIQSANKKGETIETAAPKISNMVSKVAKRDVEQAIKKVDTGADLKPGRLVGKTAGVDGKILKVLMEVSSHYGETINVVSGIRDKKGQASAMYRGWNGHLKNGKIYIYLTKNEKLRLELDELRQAKDKAGFIDCMMKKADWKKVSRHLTGSAADISTKTNPKIIKALATVLRYVRECNSEGLKCHHFDNRKLVLPIGDGIKAKWPN